MTAGYKAKAETVITLLNEGHRSTTHRLLEEIQAKEEAHAEDLLSLMSDKQRSFMPFHRWSSKSSRLQQFPAFFLILVFFTHNFSSNR